MSSGAQLHLGADSCADKNRIMERQEVAKHSVYNSLLSSCTREIPSFKGISL